MEDFIFGNEAVVRGALEAGVGFVSSYPGTPASEIADSFAILAKDAKIYFEYSTNEKVALEAAAGACFSGVKSLVIMKHYGLNVASDSLLPLVYLECPLVVVVADDPGSFSSVQTEQDSRWYSRFGHLPTLEPANPEEAKNMTQKAFEIAWQYKTPVLIRMTTRVSYVKSRVNFGKISKDPVENSIKNSGQGEFHKSPEGFKLGAGQTIALHKKTLARNEKIKAEISEKNELNFVIPGSGKFGVIVSGVGFDYLREIMLENNDHFPILKLCMAYPFPDKKIFQFCQNLDQVLVVEEIDPIIEDDIKKVCQENNLKIKIIGKSILPQTGELGPEDIEIALSKILNRQISSNLSENLAKFEAERIPARIPFWCPGCPHRETFKAVKEALGEKTIFGGDIGCYMLGAYPPAQMLDYVVSMGAGAGIAHGIAKTNNEKPVVFIGDSTFFHAGLPSLLNMVFNQSDILVIALDNRCTAMTGHQPHPGTGLTGIGEKTKEIKIEEVAKALGADYVEVINVYNPQDSAEKIKKAYAQKGVSVIVAKGECVIYKKKRMKNEKELQ